MMAAGYGLFKTTSKATRADAESTFWGFCLLCGAVILVVGLVNVLFF